MKHLLLTLTTALLFTACGGGNTSSTQVENLQEVEEVEKVEPTEQEIIQEDNYPVTIQEMSDLYYKIPNDCGDGRKHLISATGHWETNSKLYGNSGIVALSAQGNSQSYMTRIYVRRGDLKNDRDGLYDDHSFSFIRFSEADREILLDAMLNCTENDGLLTSGYREVYRKIYYIY